MKIPFSKERKKITKILIGIFIVIILIFGLNFFQKEIRGFFYSISSPIQKLFWKAGDNISDFLNSFLKTKTIKNELDELNFKNQELIAEITALKELKKENEILRAALGIEIQKDFKLILAHLVGKDISQDYLLIDKGSKDGVFLNMTAITRQKVILGKICEVYKNSSKLMLITDKKSQFDAVIQSDAPQEKEISGLVQGIGNFKLILDLISRDEKVSNGDAVITSSLGGIFPPGILVGQVEDVKKNDVEPFQKITIKPSFDISEINTLFLIVE